MTLYSDLNVSPSASADEIKKAYRRKASKAHPDRKGGDKAAFQKIQKAYEILGDPVKRLKYDQTGDTGERQEATPEQEALRVLQMIFDRAIDACLNTSHDPLQLCKAEIEKGLQEGPTVIKKINRDIAKLEKMLKKSLKSKDPAKRLLEPIIEGKILSARSAIANAEKMMKLGPLMRDMLTAYSWKSDEKPVPEFNPLFQLYNLNGGI